MTRGALKMASEFVVSSCDCRFYVIHGTVANMVLMPAPHTQHCINLYRVSDADRPNTFIYLSFIHNGPKAVGLFSWVHGLAQQVTGDLSKSPFGGPYAPVFLIISRHKKLLKPGGKYSVFSHAMLLDPANSRAGKELIVVALEGAKCDIGQC